MSPTLAPVGLVILYVRKRQGVYSTEKLRYHTLECWRRQIVPSQLLCLALRVVEV